MRSPAMPYPFVASSLPLERATNLLLMNLKSVTVGHFKLTRRERDERVSRAKKEVLGNLDSRSSVLTVSGVSVG